MRITSFLIVAALMLGVRSVQAHCDSLSGPVITEARIALEKGDVTLVLKWVPAEKERGIREAFAKAIAARSASAQAREVADRWFFETLVRVHREAEGAPFTGLKEAGFKPEEGIQRADEAIEKGSLLETQNVLLDEVRTGLQARFSAVVETRKHAADSVEAGRRYVRAYVEFIHYVERLHQTTMTPAVHLHAEHR